LVLFAWVVNISLALLVALPMFAILDSYIGGTLYEETLMQRMDDNWLQTFKEDHPGNRPQRICRCYRNTGSYGLPHRQSASLVIHPPILQSTRLR